MNDITKDVRADRESLINYRNSLVDRLIATKVEYIRIEKLINELDKCLANGG